MFVCLPLCVCVCVCGFACVCACARVVERETVFVFQKDDSYPTFVDQLEWLIVTG